MRVRTVCGAAILLAAVTCEPAGATALKVRVVNAIGKKGLAKVLVIVMSLEPGVGDVDRDLTRPDGSIPDMDIPPGFYEVIATYPYLNWGTRVRDLALRTKPVSITLELERILDQTVPLIPVFDLKVQVLDERGLPVYGARIIGRDLEAKDLAFAWADTHGQAIIRIPADGAEVTVIYGDRDQVARVDVHSHFQPCQAQCMLSNIDDLSKAPQTLTVQFK